jgi:hypothetical protein
MCHISYRRFAVSNAVDTGVAAFGYFCVEMLLKSNTDTKTTSYSKEDSKIRLEQAVHDEKGDGLIRASKTGRPERLLPLVSS